jgi:hypothetical protein
MTAHHGAIEQQHRNVEAVAPRQLRVRIYVHEVQGRQAAAVAERLQLGKHFLAQAAVFTVKQRETLRHGAG